MLAEQNRQDLKARPTRRRAVFHLVFKAAERRKKRRLHPLVGADAARFVPMRALRGKKLLHDGLRRVRRADRLVNQRRPALAEQSARAIGRAVGGKQAKRRSLVKRLSYHHVILQDKETSRASLYLCFVRRARLAGTALQMVSYATAGSLPASELITASIMLCSIRCGG